MCGVGSFIAGILAPVLGMLLLGLEWLTGRVVHPWLHTTCTTLLIVGIPLILFAGFCLDWAEAGQKRDARESARPQRDRATLSEVHLESSLHINRHLERAGR